MLVKIYKSYRDVVAICDAELIGKTFKEGKIKLQLTDFFKGEKKTSDEVRKIMRDMAREDATFNIVGKKAVKIALEEGIISKEGIKKVRGVPFALVLL